MWYKVALFILGLVFLFGFGSCTLPDTFGFYQPITLNVRAPDGPPEYKAGWHAGCKSAMSVRVFANSFVYQEGKGPEYGNGIYQHDPVFQNAWTQGWFSCVLRIGQFVDFHSMKFSPLD